MEKEKTKKKVNIFNKKCSKCRQIIIGESEEKILLHIISNTPAEVLGQAIKIGIILELI